MNKELTPLEAFNIITGQTENPFAVTISSRIRGRSQYAQACKVLYQFINKYEEEKKSINIAELEAPLVEHDQPKNYKYVHADYKLNGVIVITPTNDPKKATSIEEINKLLK